MTAVLELLYQLLGYVLTLVGLANVINTNTDHAAQESAPLEIQSAAVGAVNLLQDPTYGLVNLYNEIVAARADIGTAETAILTALGSPQQATVPVTLPTTPPTAWTTTISQSTVDGVWAAILPDGNESGADLASIYNAWVNLSSLFGLKFPNQPYLKFFSNLVGGSFAGATDPYAPLDMFTIIASDASATDWVLRAYAAYPWFHFGTDPPFYQDQADNSNNWVLDVTDDEFALMKAVVLGQFPSATSVPPIWPGIAGVTLGTPVALADGVTVPGPLHGVIVTITATPYPIGYYPFGTHKSYVKVGAVCFVSDDGDLEHPQPIGLDAQVMGPKTMVQSASAVVRLQSGVTGTITPWVLA